MSLPANVTLPPVISAGGESSCAMANSSVDLPQPDSPTMREELAARASVRSTWSTARTSPRR